MRTRSSQRAAAAGYTKRLPHREGRDVVRSRPRTRLAMKRGQTHLDAGPPWKRLKGDENLLTEHELSGKPGSKWCRVGIPSCNPYRGSVYEVGCTFSHLIDDITKGSITSYPEEFVQSLRQDKLGANLINSVEKLVDNKGFAFYSSDTRLCLNLIDAEQRPKSVICDVIILTHNYLPVVITVTEGHVDDVTKYNYSLARELTYTMRDFTDEGFNIFDAIVDIKDVSEDVLKKLLGDVCQHYKRNVPVERLCMSRERCMALTRALLAQGFTSSVNQNLETQISKNLKYLENLKLGSPDARLTSATAKAVASYEDDSVFLLTPDQFRFLNMCVNSGRVWLISSRQGTGKIRFALETARRLSLQGPTLVLCESDDFRSKIRHLRNMHVVTRPELQTNPGVCQAYDNFVVVKAEQMEFQSGKELIFDWHHNLEQAIHNRGGKLVIVYDRRDDPDIEESDIQILVSRNEDLKTCLIPDDIVLELLSKKVLSIADLIWIKKRRTREDQNEELLNSLKRSSRRGYDIFLRALRKTRQGHLADLLQNDRDPKDVLMSTDHKELLRSARGHLIHRMIPFGVLGRLYKKEVFTSSDISRIQAEKSIDLINQVLLEYLLGKPDKCFGYLLEALERTFQDHLKNLLISGDLETLPGLSSDDDKITSQAKSTLVEKVDIEDLLLELEYSNLIYKDDLRYIRVGNSLDKAFPEIPASEPHSKEAEEPARQVIDRLFELLSRKSTSPCDDLMDCLRRTGQFEVVEILHSLQGVSASPHMDTDDTGSTYRTLDVKFIETKAFQAVLDRLVDPSEVFIVLTGAPGEGKTTAALQAMRHQALQMRKLVIKTPDEFNKQVAMDMPTTVVLDDVFGIVEVSEAAVRQWVTILQRIKKHSENKTRPSIKVIITSRNHVWRAAESLSEDLNEIIPVSSVIDFTVLVPLVRAEKKRMLDSHLDKYGIDLDSALVDRIAETHGTLGFPLCCKLFAAEPMFQDNPVDFFTNPLSYIVKRLVSSCEDPSNLTLIKQVVMSKGQLDRKKAEFGSINEKSVANMKNYVFQEGNILYFPHKSIADAASYVMATKFSIDYLGDCSLQFLYERVREKPSRGKSSDADIQIHVNHKDLQSLIQRLANEMSAGNLALACSHPALATKKSVTKLFSQFKDIRKTVHLKDKKHGGSFLYWSTWNNSENLCKEALEEVENIPDADLSEAVLGCCLSGNTGALKELLSKTNLSTVRASGIRDLPKISTRQKLVANESVRVIEISGERMAHLACKYGQTEVVEILMANGLDLNETDLNGETCLLAACLGDNPTAVSFLLQNNAQWSQDNDGHSPLHLAIEKENADVLKILLDHAVSKEYLNKTDKDGQSPLHLACLKKSPEMVELLLDQKANVDVTDSCGWTPLHYVAWVGNRKIMEILIKYNADVNAACKESSVKPKSSAKLKGSGPTETEGMTALHLACHQGHVGIVKRLTDLHDINVNITDVFRKSALYIASKRGNTHLVKILLDHKADTSLATFDSRTAVYAASKKGHDQVIELLCASGTDVNTGTRSQRKRNPLYAASRKGYVSAVDTLLRHGADVNFKDSEGNTSLHVASAAGQTDVVKCLLKWGADVMARNSSQLTPLHEAVAVTDPDADSIDYLLLAGADVNAVDSRNWTPLHLASLCGTGEIVTTLLLWKADVHAIDVTNMTALGYASAVGKVDNVSVLLKYNAVIDNVCLCLAVIYGHAEAVGVLLKSKFPVKEVDEMYNLAKQNGHDKVLDIISRYRPTDALQTQ